MNGYEFKNVLRHARARFERVERWFAAADNDGRGEFAAEGWVAILSKTNEKDALDAIDIIFADDSRPKSVEDYPLRIRKIAREIAAKRPKAKGPNGEPTFDCGDCLGEGFITVFPDGTCRQEKMVEYGGPMARSIRVTVRCGKCRSDSQDIQAYNPATMVKWTLTEEHRRMNAARAGQMVAASQEPASPEQTPALHDPSDLEPAFVDPGESQEVYER